MIYDRYPKYRSFGKRRSLRLQHFDYSQPCTVHLIWGTFQRRALLHGFLAADVVETVDDQARKMSVLLIAYCVMPDHVHILVSSEGQANPLSIVGRIKGKTTHQYWRRGGLGRLWQRGFYDHVLRSSEATEDLARYILGNPVRKGLADSPGDYPFSGSVIMDLP